MSNLRVEVIEGADHMTAFTRPKFIGNLKGFLDEHSQTTAGAAAGGN